MQNASNLRLTYQVELQAALWPRRRSADRFEDSESLPVAQRLPARLNLNYINMIFKLLARAGTTVTASGGALGRA